jgi:hypothetical protein
MKPDTRRIPKGKPFGKAAKPRERCYGALRILPTGGSEAERANPLGSKTKVINTPGAAFVNSFFETEKTQ